VIILGEFEVFPLFLDKAQALHHLKGRHVQQGVLAATGLLGFGQWVFTAPSCNAEQNDRSKGC
jgi:hypothetical protein